MNALAADIGGTYSRLAWLDDAAEADEQRFANADFASLEAVIAHGLALRGAPDARIERMVLAVPGPVQADPIRLTNIDWQVERDALAARFGVAQLTIVNDFQAAALGAVRQPRGQRRVLNAVAPDAGPVVATGAGTGLGMAWLASAEDSGLPRATEGGHLDFAPNSEREVALYRWLAERYGHVSYERVLSGGGLLDSYHFLAGARAQAESPADVAALARQDDADATAAIELFVAVFAAYAGNLALAFNPTGGIYLCGGLTAHLADWFDPDSFMAVCAAKGRMAEVVRRVPVFLVTRHDAGLAGAKDILQRSTGQTHEQQ
jgi:glucokinase